MSITIQDLMIFPVKSCRGTQVKASGYSETGLDYDRQWMIIEEKTHRFLTARNIPRMVLIHPEIDHTNSTLKITIPANDKAPSSTHTIPLSSPSSISPEDLLTDCQIWGTSCTGISVGTPELNSALSTYMGQSVLLVKKGEDPREAGPEQGFVEGLQEVKIDYETSIVNWSDQFPILLVSRKSREDVESKVLGNDGYGKENERWNEKGVGAKELEIVRWRGNIIVDGVEEAWEEDGWNELRFEGADDGRKETMFVATRCARCMLPNVDPETGIRDKSVPDKVLRPYREGIWNVVPQKTFFGVNVVPQKRRGVIKVGDRVHVVKTFPRKGTEVAYERPEDE